MCFQVGLSSRKTSSRSSVTTKTGLGAGVPKIGCSGSVTSPALKSGFCAVFGGHGGRQGAVLSHTAGLQQAPLTQPNNRKRTAKPQAHTKHTCTSTTHKKKGRGRLRCGFVWEGHQTVGPRQRPRLWASHQREGSITLRPEFPPSLLRATCRAAYACLGAGGLPWGCHMLNGIALKRCR